MTAVPTDSTTPAVVPRRRGKSKGKNFPYTGPLSVIRLELDVSDDGIHRRVERQWAVVFRLRRALQLDARNRCQGSVNRHQPPAGSICQVGQERQPPLDGLC